MPYYSEKFLLKRNDFRPNSGSPYRDLRYNPDLSDVTLVSEEDQQIEAHQIASTANRYLNKKNFVHKLPQCNKESYYYSYSVFKNRQKLLLLTLPSKILKSR